MKRILLAYAVVMSMFLFAQAQETENKPLSGKDYINSLKGSYVELFSQKTCLNPKFQQLWKSEVSKYIEASKVDSVLAVIQGACQGTRTGANAIDYNKQNGSMQFCCAFLQGINRIEIKGQRISGYGSNNKKIFSHRYKFLETDVNGNYIFESVDKNNDEFRYFWFMPDSPKSTYHIEFRYGNEKNMLSQMTDGKYAFWMAAGVREGKEDEWHNGIVLFVNERLKSK